MQKFKRPSQIQSFVITYTASTFSKRLGSSMYPVFLGFQLMWLIAHSQALWEKATDCSKEDNYFPWGKSCGLRAKSNHILFHPLGERANLILFSKGNRNK